MILYIVALVDFRSGYTLPEDTVVDVQSLIVMMPYFNADSSAGQSHGFRAYRLRLCAVSGGR